MALSRSGQDIQERLPQVDPISILELLEDLHVEPVYFTKEGDSRIHCNFFWCHIVHYNWIEDVVGVGENNMLALTDYISKIRGKRIAFFYGIPGKHWEASIPLNILPFREAV